MLLTFNGQVDIKKNPSGHPDYDIDSELILKLGQAEVVSFRYSEKASDWQV